MKHILEFNEYKDDKSEGRYKVSSWDRGDKSDEFIGGAEDEDGYRSQNHVSIKEEDEEMDYFNVEIEDSNNEKHNITVQYQMFLEFIEKEMPNLKSYLDNAEFNNIDEIFDEIEELGVDFEDLLQKYVNEHVTDDTINVHSEDEEGEGMFVDEEGNMFDDEFDDEDGEDIDFEEE